MILKELGSHVVCGYEREEFDRVFFKVWILEWTYNYAFGIIINSQNGVLNDSKSRFLDRAIYFEFNLGLS